MNNEDRAKMARKSLHKMIDNQIPWDNLDENFFRFSYNDETVRVRNSIGKVIVLGKKHGKIEIEW